MNIAIGKIGRSMYFDKKSWSIYAGDDSPLIIYFTLARKYPEHTFYIIGASDFTKYKKSKSIGFNVKNGIPKNIVDLYGQSREFAGPERCRQKDTHIRGQEQWRILDDYVTHTGVQLDFGLIMQGPDVTASISGEGVLLINEDKEITPMMMGANYVAPIFHLINRQRFPYYLINEDPRYVPPNGRDILWDEIAVLSQIQTKKYKMKRLNEYRGRNFRDHYFDFRYSKIERMFLADKKKIDFSNPDNIKVGENVYSKKNKFIIALNDGPARLEYIKKWILDFHPETKIYGKWSETSKKALPDTFIEKGIVEMEDQMWESMFTYIPAFDKRLKNFVTQKPWKMIYYGIIPFYDKNSYDSEGYFKEFPDYVKVSSPKEMWKKIDYLYEHKDEYKKLLNQFYDLLLDKYFDGSFICEVFGPLIDERVKELNEQPKRRIIQE